MIGTATAATGIENGTAIIVTATKTVTGTATTSGTLEARDIVCMMIMIATVTGLRGIMDGIVSVQRTRNIMARRRIGRGTGRGRETGREKGKEKGIGTGIIRPGRRSIIGTMTGTTDDEIGGARGGMIARCMGCARVRLHLMLMIERETSPLERRETGPLMKEDQLTRERKRCVGCTRVHDGIFTQMGFFSTLYSERGITVFLLLMGLLTTNPKEKRLQHVQRRRKKERFKQYTRGTRTNTFFMIL